jgi:hypothetical protein
MLPVTDKARIVASYAGAVEMEAVCAGIHTLASLSLQSGHFQPCRQAPAIDRSRRPEYGVPHCRRNTGS